MIYRLIKSVFLSLSLLIVFSCHTVKNKSSLTNKMTEVSTLYRIDKVDFTIETAGLIGIITEEEKFCWAMDLYAAKNELEGNAVTPKFSFTELEETTKFVFDRSFEWEKATAYSEEKDDWIGSFYIFDGHFFEAELSLEKREDRQFIVNVKGRVNLNWETAPTTDFKDFQIVHLMPFGGILSEIDDKEKAIAIASKFLNTQDMKWMPRDEENGQEDNWLIYKK